MKYVLAQVHKYKKISLSKFFERLEFICCGYDL